MKRRLASCTIALAAIGCSRGEAPRQSELAHERFEPRGSALADERLARAKRLFAAFLPDAEVDTFHRAGDAIEATPSAARFQRSQLRVELPRLASEKLTIHAGAMHLAVRPRGFADAPLDWADRVATYASVSPGVDMFRVVTADGVEDLYQVDDARDELSFSYDVTLGDVAGLRLVAGALEFLDASGAPRLAVPAPIALDARGHTRLGAMQVTGCAYDSSALGPWGRAVTKPGAATCTIVATLDGRGLAYPVLVDPAWKSTANTKRSHAYHKLLLLTGGADSGKVLVVGGTGSEPMLTELFDPTTRTWATAAPLPSTLPYGGLGIGMNAVALASGHVVATGGFGIGGTSVAQGATVVRDPTTGAWRTAATMTARAWHAMVAVTVDGKPAALVIGGQQLNTVSSVNPALKSTEYYFPLGPTSLLDDSWVTGGALATGRSKLRAAVLGDGRVLAAGGETFNGSFTEGSASSDLFDPSTKTWTVAANMTAKRNQLELVALAGAGARALAAGGSSTTNYSGNQDTLEYFDGSAWTLLTAKMSQPRWLFAATRLDDGRVLFAGGESYSPITGGLAPSANAEMFLPGVSPLTGTIGGGGSMSVERKSHDLVNIPGLGALVAGGLAPSTETTSSEIFNVTIGGACPTTGTCPSGLSCVDGVCCESSSCPEGQSCNSPGREGICTKGNGSTCSGNSECASGFCVGSVCCESACTGQCRACDSTGKCNLATSGTVCSGDPICGRRCDGFGTCSFTYAPNGTSCGASLTDAGSGSFCTIYACNGSGYCATTLNQCGLTCTNSVTCDEASRSCRPIATGIKPGFCVIAGECWSYGDSNPDDPCEVCDPPVSKLAWSTAVPCIDAGIDTGVADTAFSFDTGGHDTGSVADTRPLVDTAVDATADAAAPEASDSSGCGCRVPGASSNTPVGALAALALAVVLATRRRR